jgi:sphinganine-1-phosphate aldolase
MEYFRQAKRNLNSFVEPTVKRYNLDTLDIAIVSVVLYFFVVFLWRNFHLFPQKAYWIGLKRRIVQRFLKISFVTAKIDTQIKKVTDMARENFRKGNPATIKYELGEKGISWEEIDQKLAILTAPDRVIKENGKLSGMYYAPRENNFEKNIVDRAGEYLYFNLLHVDKLLGIRQIESELISFFLKLLKADSNCVGSTTCGGTESILIAIYSMREYAFATKGITEPELILCETAHPAFYKACNYFKIKAVRVPMDKKTFTMDMYFFKKRITSNTIGAVGSAINYPHGLVDPLEDMAKVLKPYNIPIHADCCLGGYSMIFAKELGFDVQDGTFSNPGITTISIDPHKYGMAPKGISLLLFRNPEIKKAGIFVQEDWVGGMYGTACVTGSKPSASVAGAWIASQVVGKAGLRDAAKRMHDCLMELKRELLKIPGIKIIGNPQFNTLAFYLEGHKFDTTQLAVGLMKRDWHTPLTQKPFSIHVGITECNIDNVKTKFIREVKEVMAEMEKDPKLYSDNQSAQIYCTKIKVPDSVIIGTALKSVIAEFSVA